MILVCGDIHGEWDSLFYKIKVHNIKDCTLIIVGDIGIGFKGNRDKELRALEHHNMRFKKHNINMLCIRGNHDDPSYFDGSISYSHLELLPDYTTRLLDEELFLFVGGAISIDKHLRKEGISWWKDEGFVLDENKAHRADVVITHSAPTWNGPTDKTPFTNNISLFEECKQERVDISRLLQLTYPLNHYCGHFHQCYQAEHDGCLSRILDILEIKEHRKRNRYE
jgi:Icc-related predicted phosphoesterase